MENQRTNIKIGFAPTRRNASFGVDEAIKYKELIRSKLNMMGVDFIDIQWLNSEGLIYEAKDVETVADRFKEAGIDALFIPHCNFGAEDVVAKLAKKLQTPLLLWGPRDEAPMDDAMKLRHTQCGLFATSKVLMRFGVPFTYLENCRIDDPIFEEGLKTFIAAARVVKCFNNMRIGQISTRPAPFLSVMFNEGELLERFGIETVPTTITEIIKAMDRLIEKKDLRLGEYVESIQNMIKTDNFGVETLMKLAALKYAVKDWADSEGLSAIGIQCWSALQEAIGIVPCFVIGDLTGEGLPVVCETDICGAVTSVMAQAAKAGDEPIFFADLTVRHPENDNAELLWHCGPYSYKLKKEGCEAKLSGHYFQEPCNPALGEFEIKHGEITICRFDGDHGKYSFLMANGKGVDGPKTRGTYLWAEFKNWPALEKKIIYGPYIHHVTGVYGNVVPAILEAIKYIPGIEIDTVM